MNLGGFRFNIRALAVAAALLLVILLMKPKLDRAAFVAKVKPFAEVVEKATGIPAAFAIAQAAHESNNGNSEAALLDNNYFGIKTGVLATVPRTTINRPTKEWDNTTGQYVTVNATFARYTSIQDAFTDWGNYIVRKYPAAAAAARRGDFKAFAAAVAAGGYATDPQYAAKLVSTYEAIA